MQQTETLGVYSIVYNSKKNGSFTHAIDWNWQKAKMWACSEKEGSAWYSSDLDNEAYLTLLEHFGLEEWRDEFPMNRIISMNPQQLTGERREKEKLYNLPRMEMRNSTLGKGYGQPSERFV